MILHKILESIGLVTLTLLVGVILGLIIVTIWDRILKLIHIYKRKHRFDKPPTAKCYCKDCAYHGILMPNGCECPGRKNYYSPDDGFCHEAKPKEREKSKMEKIFRR